MATDIQSLPSQYDHAAAQGKWYAFWEERGYFHADAASEKPPFSVVIPPPNVTGALHLGHALNNTLQDILCRMRRMQGYEVLWMPGTDHAGIATQAVVERRLLEEEGKSRHDLGSTTAEARENLVDRIWDWKREYEKRILGQLKQMGFSCDWERLRFTLDDQCAQAVRETFFRLFSDGKIYRGKRLVNWDTFLQTAVSDDEVFHEPVKGHFWHFRYPVIDPKPGEPEFVTIATTRPETMLGDTAVAVHPDPARQLDKVEAELKEKLAAAPDKEKDAVQAGIDALAERRKTKLAELKQLCDMAADGRMLRLPLADREIPLIADVWAKPELGSGCVKITPAHDANDYEVWQRNLEIGAVNIMERDGTLNDAVPEKYRGLTMKKVRTAVVDDLTELGLHDPETDREDREIDLAHSDRSKTPIEPYLADQWFVKMDEVSDGPGSGEPGLAQTAMDAVTDGRVKIVPDRYAKSYLDWLGEKRDWPVGRQLWWGHRIPVWSIDAEEARKRISELQAAGFTEIDDAAFALADDGLEDEVADQEHKDEEGKVYAYTDFGHPIYTCVGWNQPEFEKRLAVLGFEQSEEVLDTWFSSALWPHSTMGWPDGTAELDKFYPTSTLITSRDIITLWVARMVLMGEFNMNNIPFDEVYIHPKILDGYGETMSKSKGNGVDPLDIIDKYGADSLRFGLAYLTTETQDVRMPVEFECPHCSCRIKQTKKNRVLPRVECDSCGKPFGTQWSASHGTEEDKQLLRGAAVSERFELARNFCNKLWNASRFALLNLEGYE
ncbi:MAG: class I tRNA ligase family protein, partial [Planctomycetota bacterium]